MISHTASVQWSGAERKLLSQALTFILYITISVTFHVSIRAKLYFNSFTEKSTVIIIKGTLKTPLRLQAECFDLFYL